MRSFSKFQCHVFREMIQERIDPSLGDPITTNQLLYLASPNITLPSPRMSVRTYSIENQQCVFGPESPRSQTYPNPETRVHASTSTISYSTRLRHTKGTARAQCTSGPDAVAERTIPVECGHLRTRMHRTASTHHMRFIQCSHQHVFRPSRLATVTTYSPSARAPRRR